MKYFTLMFFLLISFSVVADDLDDGVKLDEPINDDINLDVNIQFIKRRAKAAAESVQNGNDVNNKIAVNTACGGTGNQSFGAGSNLTGATIVNLSDNRGSSAVCAK
ncbi:MAG: hypothetical protein QNL62_09490 [Gammaproteobacteria bacterium]|nr:hypothetical protein [Gammaproteobacteria bacterium]